MPNTTNWQDVRRRRPPKVYGTSKDGTPITDEIADELAAEAERGYDLDKGRRIVGRPSLAGDDHEMA